MATRGATQTSVVAEERNGVGWREARNSEHGADGCVLGGSESIALELVRLGSDPSFDTGHMDFYDARPLSVAASNGHVDTLRAMITAGAYPKALWDGGDIVAYAALDEPTSMPEAVRLVPYWEAPSRHRPTIVMDDAGVDVYRSDSSEDDGCFDSVLEAMDGVAHSETEMIELVP